MLFILEIVLTVFAWRNGWKWLALLPLGVVFVMGFCIGLGIGSTGGSMSSDVQGIIYVLDFSAIIALILMIAKKRVTETTEAKVEATDTETKKEV